MPRSMSDLLVPRLHVFARVCFPDSLSPAQLIIPYFRHGQRGLFCKASCCLEQLLHLRAGQLNLDKRMSWTP